MAEIVNIIINAILNKLNIKEFRISPSTERKVTDILEILKTFKYIYFEKGTISNLKDKFEFNLFNTFRTYIDIKQHNPVKL